MASFQPSIASLRDSLLNLSEPISKRTHAAFYLRTEGSLEAMTVISEAVLCRDDSSLMRHELAYILGQMQYKEACGVLASILEDETEDLLVRHESAEAIGAIGAVEYMDVLERFSSHPAPEIRETCKIATDLISWRQSQDLSKSENISKTHYLSVDPAPAFPDGKNVETLRETLLDSSKSLFERYRAMFSLRNMNSDDAAMALIGGFQDESALFRHEIAYVLGQMERSVTVDGLAEVLKNTSEHRMVRHEAAEALGAIGGSQVEEILAEFRDDPEVVVLESCQVALDNMDYWSQFGQQ